MDEKLLLADARLLDPEGEPARGSLLIERGRIAARLPPAAVGPEDARRLELHGARLGPGLVDLHYHGDLVLRPAAEAAASLASASASLLRQGVTAFLPTTVAWPAPELADRVTGIAAALAEGAWPGAEPLGLHLEGPWIRAEAAGAQPAAGIRAAGSPAADAAEARELATRAAGAIRMVTLAPERVGALALIEQLVGMGVVVAVGHTLASPAELARAVAAGARHATHLFNAMGPLHQRGPGVAAHVLAEDRLSCDVIADGAHVHPDWLHVASRVKGEALLLISDAVGSPVDPGVPGGLAPSFGSGALRSDGSAWRLPDGRLAASHLALHDAARNLERWRVMTRHEALAACTVRPARLLGLEGERGTLRAGARADLVCWSEDGRVAATWLGGRLAWVDDALGLPPLPARS